MADSLSIMYFPHELWGKIQFTDHIFFTLSGAHLNESEIFVFICATVTLVINLQTVTRENEKMCSGGQPQGLSVHSLKLCLTGFNLLFRETMQPSPSSDRSIKKYSVTPCKY